MKAKESFSRDIVSSDEWRKRRLVLLQKEKEFTKLRDQLSLERRTLPWVEIEKNYSFTGEKGEQSLGQLFGDKNQLIVYHFMFDPAWQEGCKSCSFWADNFNGILPHLEARNTRFVCISRGDLEVLLAFKQRMGWSFDWLSSANSDFNYDFHVSLRGHLPEEYNYRSIMTSKASEWPGISVYYKEGDKIFHTYSCYARELETYNLAYRYLDLIPEGRNEDEFPFGMGWVRHRDKY